MERLPEQFEARAEVSSEDPKNRERSILERAAKGPVGRWLSMAALALSTEGCAQFSAIVTGEGIARGGVNVRAGARQYREGETYASVALEMAQEKPGARMWWRKEEGVYDPNEKADQENIPKNIPRIVFGKEERRPDNFMTVVHARRGDTPVSMAERGVGMALPAIPEGSGVKLEWHAVTGWAGKGPEPKVSLRVTPLEAPDQVTGEPTTLEEAVLKQAFAVDRDAVFLSTAASKRYKDRAAQLAIVKRVYWPMDMADDATLRQKKRAEAINQAIEAIGMAGTGETRIYILQKEALPGEITCVAVMDDPMVEVEIFKKDL